MHNPKILIKALYILKTNEERKALEENKAASKYKEFCLSLTQLVIDIILCFLIIKILNNYIEESIKIS